MSQVPLTISIGQKEPSSLRLVFTLFAAGLISGLALAGVYQGTKPMIERNNARALQRAVYNVVPGSTQMQQLTLQDGTLVAVTDEIATGPIVIAAYDDAGAFVGYAIPAEGPGFQDTIRLIFGYDPARNQVIGMEVLESRETPGLGDTIIKDLEFVGNFADLAVEPEIVLVKDGRAAANQVDAITGATISSRAVVNIINAANATWLEALPAPNLLPPLPEPAEAAPIDTTDEEDA